MKKILLLAITILAILPAFADLNGNGFYRIQNAYTKRYVYVLDNRGSYDAVQTTADVGAIGLYKDVMKSKSDPATVLYLQNASGSEYDIAAQGTSIFEILGLYVRLLDAKTYDGSQSYYIYASKSGMSKYLGDLRSDSDRDDGYASVDAKGDRRKWYINPLNSSADEYFGIAPTVTAGQKYYYPLFAGFPFSAKSDGMKFFIISRIDPVGVAVVKEVTGTVPAGAPVIVQCSKPLPSDNRLNIGTLSDYGNVDGNQLSGIYFDNETNLHYNRTPFDRNSMRVLGVAGGKLAFVRGDYDYIPRNQAYLKINDASLFGKDNLLVMTEAELEEYKKNSVDVIPEDSIVDIYTVDGRLVKSNFPKSEVSTLPKGLFILRNGMVSEKLLLK